MDNLKTLLVNSDYSPISINPLSIISWQEAIKFILMGKASVLYEYDKKYVHSPSITLNVPSVIFLNEYVKSVHKVKYNRSNIYLRDNYTCQYCGLYSYERQKDNLTLDHVIPRARNGESSFENIVTACSNCNIEKAHFMKMKPINKPYKPTYFQLVKIRKLYPIKIPDIRWNELLGWDAGLIEINDIETDYIQNII